MSQTPNTTESKKNEDRILTPGQLVIKRFVRNKLAIAGMIMLSVIVIFCFVCPIFSPYGAYEMFYSVDGKEIRHDDIDYNNKDLTIKILAKEMPNKSHWLGTDTDGRDVLTRLMLGGRISITVGIAVVAMQIILGMIFGGIAGFYGGWLDNLIMRIVDVFFCIPTLPEVLILSSILLTLKIPQQHKIYYLCLVIAFLGWAGVARLVRGQILSLREQEFMVAAEASGIKPAKRIFKHLIPNVMPQLIVSATLSLGGVILFESALSFLGFGVPQPYPSWGNMIDAARDLTLMRSYLHLWIPPGIAILLTVMAFNFIGDGLRDAYDPKMKR